MSTPKPIQCKVNEEFLKPLHDKFPSRHIKFIETQSCSAFDIFHTNFQGNIVNGTFEGAGNLKILWQYQAAAENPELQKTCVNLFSFEGKTPVEINGTFKDGSLEGIALVKFEDKSFLIATMANNVVNGLVRKYDSEGKLSMVFYHDGKGRGFSWTLTKHFLIGSDSSFMKKIENFSHEASSIFIPTRE